MWDHCLEEISRRWLESSRQSGVLFGLVDCALTAVFAGSLVGRCCALMSVNNLAYLINALCKAVARASISCSETAENIKQLHHCISAIGNRNSIPLHTTSEQHEQPKVAVLEPKRNPSIYHYITKIYYKF